MTKHPARVLPLVAVMALAACDASIDPPTPGPGPGDSTVVPFDPGPFPNAIGTLWIYHNPSFGHTMQVRVTDTMRAEDGHLASIWTSVTESGVTDHQYVAVFGDTVMFYMARYSSNPWNIPLDDPTLRPKLIRYYHYLLSAPPGSSWSSSIGDSTSVTDLASLDVPAGHFDDVTVISHELFNHTTMLWLKPGVGFVKMESGKSGTPGIPLNRTTWVLVRFLP